MGTRYNYKHGERKTRLYKIWCDMKARCNNPKKYAYEHYGGRGIRYADDWEEYIPFSEWAKSSGYADNLTLDRIDPNGNYEPHNCRWVTMTVQNRNKRDNKNNSSGVRGVRKSVNGTWHATITVGREARHLGYFDTIEEAAAVRKQAEIDYWQNGKEYEPPNKIMRRDNSTGILGVHWHKASGKWSAIIGVNKKSIHLGLFDTKEQAAEARKKAEVKYWGKAVE